MKDIQLRYRFGGVELLDNIGPLWEGLRSHHKEKSVHFKQRYEKLTFTIRKKALMDKAEEGQIYIETAEDLAKNMLIGFCVSSIDRQKNGEIDSIFILDEYRGQGIGDHFMKTALGWMERQEASTKTIRVAAGNEAAFLFYARYGFYPAQTILLKK